MSLIRVVHRHIFYEIGRTFVLSLSCLLGIILLGRMLQLREALMGQAVSLWDIAQLFFYLCPFFLMLVMPIAVMLAVFLTFLRMSTENELVALKASGLSLYQLLPTPLFFSVLAAVCTLFISYYGLSWGMEQFRDKMFQLVNTRTEMTIQAGVFNQQIPGITFYANQVKNGQQGEMRFVFVQDKRQKGITYNIVADLGKLAIDKEEDELFIGFENGHIYRRDKDKLNIMQFASYAIHLPLTNLFGNFHINKDKPSDMSVAKLLALRDHPDKYPNLDIPPEKIRMELTKRRAMPAACFVLGLFAMPIACIFRGMRQQYGLILALGIFMLYYSFFSVAASIGKTGLISPELGMWGTNILFLLIALHAMHLAANERRLYVVNWTSSFLAWIRSSKKA